MEIDETKLDGAEKSALILLALGKEVATEVFKNGDLVEVDADKGIVRKI